MRGFALAVILLCASTGPAIAKERASRSTSKTTKRGGGTEKPADSATGSTAASETSSTSGDGKADADVTANAKAPSPPQPFAMSSKVTLGVGGFFGGGANSGPAVAAIWTLTPNWSLKRIAFDVELDWRMARFSTAVDGFGTLTSTLHQFPLFPVVRVHLLDAKKVGVDARVGVGPLFVLHVLSSDFAVTTTRSALGWEGFAGVQLHVALTESIDVVADARFSLGEAAVPFVLGRASGVQGLLGVRYAIP